MIDQTQDWAPYLRATWRIAGASPDPRTQNAAIIIDVDGKLVSAGLNQFPTGVLEDPDRWNPTVKDQWVEHAERNAIYRAAKLGASTQGATMVCGWAACIECARAIVQAGLIRLVRHNEATIRSHGKWKQRLGVADMILSEGGVEIVNFRGRLGSTASVRHDGIEWNP